MSIFDVRHQERAHRIIQRAMTSQRIPHAYLFVGPEGVGKEMLALRLGRVLLCESPIRQPAPEGVSDSPLEAQDACGQCADCRLVEAGTHPDLHLIYRQLNRQHPEPLVRKQKALFVGVDVIRHFLIGRAGTCPSRGRAKVFVVREAERMNEAAQNCLLKSLEEPSPSTFIILISSALDRMLPTVRSRCQPVAFQPLPTDFVSEQLHKLRPDADPQAINYLAQRSGGSLGVACKLLDDGLFPIKQAWGDQLAALLRPARGFAPNELAKPFAEDAKKLGKCVSARDPDVSDTDATRQGLQSLLAVLADYYLDALRRRVGAVLPAINSDHPEIAEQLAVSRATPALLASLRAITETDTHITRNANIDLALESLFIKLARNSTGQAA
ncbi:MAG: DNA polymerase III subunit delta' [Phycisphaerales bacterium]|nr:DNA polymerase III subunit delta' [Phycisphaerales bacterium]